MGFYAENNEPEKKENTEVQENKTEKIVEEEEHKTNDRMEVLSDK